MVLTEKQVLKTKYKDVVVSIYYVTGYVHRVHIEDGSFIGGPEMAIKSTPALSLCAAMSDIDYLELTEIPF